MIPVKPIDPEDLPLYAMQLLSPEEMEELTLQLQHSVEARRVLSEIYGDLSTFAQSAEMNSPPALTRQRLMKAVAREKRVVPSGPLDHLAPTPDAYAPRATSLFEEEPLHRGFVQKAAPWLGWAIAAGVALFAVTEHQEKQQLQSNLLSARKTLRSTQGTAEAANAALDTIKDPAAVHATLTSVATKPLPTGRVAYVADKGSLIFIASNLAPLQPYKTYELWVIPADGRDPIPAGTFKPDEHGYASVVMPELAKGVPAKAFGVTIEDGGGSQTPTAPILLQGLPS